MFTSKYIEKSISIPIFIGTIYIFGVFIMQAIANDITITGIFILFLLFVSFFITTSIMKMFSEKVLGYTIGYQNSNSKIYAYIIFTMTIGIFAVHLAGVYPGGMSPDTAEQYSQAIGEANYNDWHPVLHTLLFFTLPLKTGHHLGFVVFLQLLYFSMAFSYLSYVLLVNGGTPKFVFLMCVYIWVNPFMTTYMMYPWKDIAFMIFAVLLTAYYIQVICTKGEWLFKKRNQILFAVTAVVCMTMRHNGILFVLPMFFIAACHVIKKKKVFLTTMLFLIVGVFGIRVLYVALNVERPGSRIVETVGLPVTIWCNVMQKSPEALPEGTKNFFYMLGDQEVYDAEYIAGSFNSIKWSENFDKEKINEMSYKEIIGYTAQCFWCAPQESIEALAKLTELVWGIGGEDEPITVSIIENAYGISYNPISYMETIANQIKSFFNIGVGKILFGSHGYRLLVLWFLSCILLIGRRISVIHIIPLFFYNFGTMLLLSGRDYRFFLLNIPLIFPTVFIMLQEQRKFNSNNIKECEEALRN